jgi:peroxiredoxin
MRSAPSRWLGLLTVILSIGLVLGSAYTSDKSSPIQPGRRTDNIVFTDLAGKRFMLHDFSDKKAIVVVFLSFECPMSNSYVPFLSAMARTYAERGVAFLAVSSNEADDPAQLAKHAREYKLPFPLFKDQRHAAAHALEAQVTPEAFLLDNSFVLRYRGRIDDAYAARLKKNSKVSRHDLKEALDELLAGKPVSTPVTQAIGCPIQVRARSVSDGTSGSSVTYHRNVLPILQKHCQECHRPGQVGPFSLLTYRQAVTWADDIVAFTSSRSMPPWKPIEGGPFHSERRMSDAEISLLKRWVESGAPEGNPKDAPPPRQFTDGWKLGQPDLVLTVSEDFQLGASGPDVYRYFVLPTDLPEDKYVTAVEVRPGNGRVVHHAILFYDRSGRARQREIREQEKEKARAGDDRGPGFSMAMALGFLPGFLPEGGMGGWAPGLMPRHLPDGVGYHLPKGADVIMQLHYSRSGRIEKDRTSVGLYFSKNPANRRIQGLVIPGQFLVVPAGVERYRVTGSMTVKQDCEIHALAPHMHLLGREITMRMLPPDGPPRMLVAIKDWDFNWQEVYFLKDSIPVKQGTRFEVEGIYDNSAKNPRNPHRPPRPVFLGEQTENEMCVGFLGVTSSRPGPIRYSVDVKLPGFDKLGLPLFGL